MNAKQAKQLDFPALLEKLGHLPVKGGVKKGGHEIWYKSPFAKEQTASFHLTRGNKVAWIFKCFSSGKEGHILDFVIEHELYTKGDIKSALAFLRQLFPGPLFENKGAGDLAEAQTSFSFHEQEKPGFGKAEEFKTDRDLEYIEDLPLQSKLILTYLEENRKISPVLAQQYLRLVRYKNLKKGKNFYAFGMKNRAGGFEIRAASESYTFKSALIARDISIVPGASDKGNVMVFEGMTDFLSFLAMTETHIPFCDAIILHSVNSYQRCAAYISSQQYRHIHTFLDNDATGQQCTQRFEAHFGTDHSSHSASFSPHKDLNAALVAGLHITFRFPGGGEPPTHMPTHDR